MPFSRLTSIIPQIINPQTILYRENGYASIETPSNCQAKKVKGMRTDKEKSLASTVLSVSLLILGAYACVHARTRTQPGSQEHSASTRSAADLFRLLSPSVFVVEALDEDGSVVAFGSGVVVASDEIETNTHVIDPGIAIRVRQGPKTWPAQIEHISLHSDLCLLRVDRLNVPFVTLRPSKTLLAGEQVYAIGAPEGLELTISSGLISGLRRFDGKQVIQTSAPISHGSSGGGLFDIRGNLVGITTSMLVTGQNLNFALPVDPILDEPDTPRDFDLVQRHLSTGLRYKEALSFGKDEVDKDLQDIRLAEQILRKNVSDAHAHAILGDRLLIIRDDPHRALRELHEAQALGDDSADLHTDVATALGRVGDVYGAVRESTRAVELAPNEAGGHVELMDDLMDDEAETKDVLHEAQAAAHLHAPFSVMLPDAAKWMLTRGDKNSALAICQEILVAKLPSLGHRCLGMTQWLGNPRDEAQSVAEFRQAVQLDGGAWSHHDLAIVLELTGKFDEALEQFKTAADAWPTSQEFKADYETALKDFQSRAAPGDKNEPDVGEFLNKRRRLEAEIGCDIMVVLPCPHSGPE